MNAAELKDAFRRYKDVLYRYPYRMTGSSSAAEDIVQDCFLALWQGRATYNSERGDMRTFLLGVARKKILMEWRQSRPYEDLDDQPARVLPENPISLQLIASERTEMIAQAIATLPPFQHDPSYRPSPADLQVLPPGVSFGNDALLGGIDRLENLLPK